MEKNINLTKYTIEEIVELKNLVENYLHAYDDGYLYICKVRSYGSNWTKYVTNSYSLQEICYRYNGDEGIVDVFSTNPNLTITNYGDVKYIKSKEDYEQWCSYNNLEIIIRESENEIIKWNMRHSLSFRERPLFEPFYSQEEINEMKEEYNNFNMSFTPPKDYDSQ